MAEPFISEIRVFAFNFAPKGWAKCDGQLMAISQNQALYSLIGTIYGGDGRTTFALPDLRGRAPTHHSETQPVGAKGGTETVTLTTAEMPAHSHGMRATNDSAETESPSGALVAQTEAASYGAATAMVPLNGTMVTNTGETWAHENMQPSLVLNACISLFGVFPPRN
ncbi:phage tail protein [Roseospira goensis]|uniref:Microcystin-dependent protein n=1 Tax=Roseospira goensis TaxID=391922 RepID=A0A7W6WKR4_9PROT|nr:tail fiber protein [Roseospira goensis]MBB4286365.1 microcystin-dependent protein [Roseospira goensis]